MQDETIAELIADFEQLPPEVQKVIYWLVQNLDIVDEMIEKDDAVPETYKRLLKSAKMRENIYMQALIKYALVKKFGDTYYKE